jgi:LL-H family phage holin
MDILFEFLKPIFLAIAGFFGYQVAILIKRYVDKQTLAQKQELVAIAVKMVEQMYKELDGEEKYNKAVEWVTAEATRLGIKITENEMRGLIESAVKTFKDQFAKQW